MWVDFGIPEGSEPGYRRPAVVVSSERFNRSRIATLVVVAVTSNRRLGAAPGNVTLPLGTAGLDRVSIVNVTEVMTVDRRRVVGHQGHLRAAARRDVDAGLRLSLGL